MKDVQNQKDNRNVYLQRVGIRNLSYPITVMDKANGYQDTVARINMYVDLPEHFRGTHMSRFVEVLNKYRLGIDPKLIRQMLEELRTKLRASTARVEIEFPYFVLKKAPVSNQESFLSYICRIEGQKTLDRYDFVVSVGVPVLTLCPCSKEISDRGAHNQRAMAWIHIRSKNSSGSKNSFNTQKKLRARRFILYSKDQTKSTSPSMLTTIPDSWKMWLERSP